MGVRRSGGAEGDAAKRLLKVIEGEEEFAVCSGVGGRQGQDFSFKASEVKGVFAGRDVAKEPGVGAEEVLSMRDKTRLIRGGGQGVDVCHGT